MLKHRYAKRDKEIVHRDRITPASSPLLILLSHRYGKREFTAESTLISEPVAVLRKWGPGVNTHTHRHRHTHT